MIDGETRFVALLGYPVEHSLSPRIHNAAFQSSRLNVRYGAFAVPSEQLAAAVSGLAALGFIGANVTIPHKQAVRQYVDELSMTASAVGAVNTLVFREDGSVFGDNTDVSGFMAPLAEHAASIRARPATVIGSGGAARAVIYALATRVGSPSIHVAARSRDKAEAMLVDLRAAAGRLDVHAQVVPQEEASASIRESRLIVNCTPVGMAPRIDETPWARKEDFGADHVVYDLIYNPRRTRLLTDAAERGAMTIDGLEMLIAQAAESYRQWTGADMPLEAVRSALSGVGVDGI